MDMNNVNIEEIVKQVLSGMTGNAPAQTAAPAAQAPAAPTADPVIPKTAHVAMLTALEHNAEQAPPIWRSLLFIFYIRRREKICLKFSL